ncbi:2-nitropropane dioxygenase [Hyphodiscus hymeniophilus]|uniref:2-nitropropane dioxygenase n=1 Tax=Hyphodiscus hymeniophilus TaxID=353542 RepID=A0A9P6VNA6_9HELO|nr:2-nitropropane dioxygenase [Hyphodiscus hymeniophilus]
MPLIVGAPMRIFAGPALATTITKAGGIGFMGPGAKASDLDSCLSEAKSLLDTTSIPTVNNLLPVGIGFQTFAADLTLAGQAIQKHKPCAVWLFVPREGQKELDAWSSMIKGASPETKVWIQVGSVSQAVQAAGSAFPPDVLVVQGIDAGGHGLAKGAGVISLLPEVLDELGDFDIPIIAAGGITDGRGVAAALSLGAVGVAMGTRFLAANEAKISKGYQGDVLSTRDGGQNTVRTTLYDHLAGRTDWPHGYDGRNVVNRSVLDHESGVEFEENRRLYEEATKKGDQGWGQNGRMTAYVGSGVGLIREVVEAGQIVKTARTQAKNSLERARSVL